jgi:hypothetical protein
MREQPTARALSERREIRVSGRFTLLGEGPHYVSISRSLGVRGLIDFRPIRRGVTSPGAVCVGMRHGPFVFLRLIARRCPYSVGNFGKRVRAWGENIIHACGVTLWECEGKFAKRAGFRVSSPLEHGIVDSTLGAGSSMIPLFFL